MLEFTRLFLIERSIFQRFVIVYKYVRFLHSDPLVKNILQKIFDNTAKVIGESDECLNEDKFLNVKGKAIFSREFWIYYTNLEIIYNNMKKMKTCDLDKKDEFNQLYNLFSKPYSKKMLDLSFEVVNSEVFDQLNQKSFFDNEDDSKKTYFDEQKSILYVKGEKVKINKQNKITNAHKILRHIFITNKDNLDDDFYYAEIAEDEFGELDYAKNKNAGRMYYTACCKLQEKIQDQTKNKIDNFMKFSTGKTGKIKINKRYL